jgi:hypothetical protein
MECPEEFNSIRNTPGIEDVIDYMMLSYNPEKRGQVLTWSWLGLELFFDINKSKAPDFLRGRYHSLYALARACVMAKKNFPTVTDIHDALREVYLRGIPRIGELRSRLLYSRSILSESDSTPFEGVVAEESIIPSFIGVSTCMGINGEAPHVSPGNTFSFGIGDTCYNIRAENLRYFIHLLNLETLRVLRLSRGGQEFSVVIDDRIPNQFLEHVMPVNDEILEEALRLSLKYYFGSQSASVRNRLETAPEDFDNTDIPNGQNVLITDKDRPDKAGVYFSLKGKLKRYGEFLFS